MGLCPVLLLLLLCSFGTWAQSSTCKNERKETLSEYYNGVDVVQITSNIPVIVNWVYPTTPSTEIVFDINLYSDDQQQLTDTKLTTSKSASGGVTTLELGITAKVTTLPDDSESAANARRPEMVLTTMVLSILSLFFLRGQVNFAKVSFVFIPLFGLVMFQMVMGDCSTVGVSVDVTLPSTVKKLCIGTACSCARDWSGTNCGIGSTSGATSSGTPGRRRKGRHPREC